MYDPEVGRFLERDPLARPFWSQGINPYSYVGNNPLNAVDPSGWQDQVMPPGLIIGFAPNGGGGSGGQSSSGMEEGAGGGGPGPGSSGSDSDMSGMSVPSGMGPGDAGRGPSGQTNPSYGPQGGMEGAPGIGGPGPDGSGYNGGAGAGPKCTMNAPSTGPSGNVNEPGNAVSPGQEQQTSASQWFGGGGADGMGGQEGTNGTGEPQELGDMPEWAGDVAMCMVPVPIGGIKLVGGAATRAIPALARAVRSLRALGLGQGATRALLAGEQVAFETPGIVGFARMQGNRLVAGIFSINAPGKGVTLLAQFRAEAAAAGRALGATELELVGAEFTNSGLQAMLLRQGFAPSTIEAPAALGGGSMSVVSKVFGL